MLCSLAFVSVLAATTAPSPPPCDGAADGFNRPSLQGAAPDLRWDLEPRRRVTVQLPGMSHHFSEPKDRHGRVLRNRHYNERNWGIGMQAEEPLAREGWQDWVVKYSAGVLKDSLDAMGLYAGVTLQERVLDKQDYSVDAGAGGFVFYRTLRFGGPHLLVPAVLPVLSVLHKPTQIGLNALAIPRFTISGREMPAVVFVQFTRAF